MEYNIKINRTWHVHLRNTLMATICAQEWSLIITIIGKTYHWKNNLPLEKQSHHYSQYVLQSS